jgi:thiamine biosynthesis lipoprotein ApbE
MEIDLGGIAKGYIVDRTLVNFLKSKWHKKWTY